MNILYTDAGNALHLDKEVGRGGEGAIHLVHGYPDFVAKVYTKQQNPEVHRKLLAMVQNPPHDPTINGPYKHRSIAWPQDLLYLDRQKTQFVGFTMPKIDLNAFNKLLNYISPDDKTKNFLGGFTWRHLFNTAYNLASCVASIHDRGYCVGDINESNILVAPTTLLTVIDCDSFQVKDPTRNLTWRCTVGKVEYTAPELLGHNYRDVDRTPETDCFALAVMIFQLLMEGTHPYAAKGKLVDDAATTRDKIIKGIFPYKTSLKGIAPPDYAPAFDMLHPQLQTLFKRCFDDGHRNSSVRPTAKEWMSALRNLLSKNFKKCSKNDNHFYLDHLNSCYWCDSLKKTGKDSYPSSVGHQVLLANPNNQLISLDDRKAYLLTYVEMALMDGHLSPEEEAFLIDQGLKLHIPEKETKKLIADEIKKRGFRVATPGSPVLRVDKGYFDFKNVKNGSIFHETIEISNVGTGVLSGSISTNANWIIVPATFAPNQQNQSQKIQITIDTSSLRFGFSGMGTINILSNGGNISVTVHISTEGLQILFERYRYAFPLLPSVIIAFILSFVNPGAIWLGVLFGGGLTYIFTKQILKYFINRNLDISKCPPFLLYGISAGIVVLTIVVHSGGAKPVFGRPSPANGPEGSLTTNYSQPEIVSTYFCNNVGSGQPNDISKLDGVFYHGLGSTERLYFYCTYKGATANKTTANYKWYYGGQEISQGQKVLEYDNGNVWFWIDRDFSEGQYAVSINFDNGYENRYTIDVRATQDNTQPNTYNEVPKVVDAFFCAQMNSNNPGVRLDTYHHSEGETQRLYFYCTYKDAVVNKTTIHVTWYYGNQEISRSQRVVDYANGNAWFWLDRDFSIGTHYADVSFDDGPSTRYQVEMVSMMGRSYTNQNRQNPQQYGNTYRSGRDWVPRVPENTRPNQNEAKPPEREGL